MTNRTQNRIATGAIIALTVISILAVFAGIVTAWLGAEVEGVFAIVTGAVGGIVAIVLQSMREKSPP